jgi:hypothetical protein
MLKVLNWWWRLDSFEKKWKVYLLILILTVIFLTPDWPKAEKERWRSLEPELDSYIFMVVLPAFIWPVTIPAVLYLKWGGYNKYYSTICINPKD